MNLKKIKAFFLPLKWFFINLLLLKRVLSFDNTKNKTLLLLTPQYGNIGDHCIAIAENKLLKDNFPLSKIDEIPFDLINPHSGIILRFIKKRYSLVCVTGGGFLGTIWPYHDKKVNLILRTMKDVKIIIFPQTLYFAEDKLVSKVKRNYDNCEKLLLCIRDKSYSVFQKYDNNFSILSVPDIVMYLNYSNLNLSRQGIICCFRNDRERLIDKTDKLNLLKEKYSGLIKETDTVRSGKIKLLKRQYYVSEKINEFASSELVITDRLHGMLLALITGTPCIALDNISGKVEGVWNLWLKENKGIKFIHSDAELTVELIESMRTKTSLVYDENQYSDFWKKIVSFIKF